MDVVYKKSWNLDSLQISVCTISDCFCCSKWSVRRQWSRLCVIDLIMTSLLHILTLTLLSLPVRCLPVEEDYQYDDPTEEVRLKNRQNLKQEMWLQVSSREEEVAATFDIEMVTRTTEFRVRPGDKVALPCEVSTSGDHMSVHHMSRLITILVKMLLEWGRVFCKVDST